MKGLKYISLIIAGILLILLSNVLVGPRIIVKANAGDEYYFSKFLISNYWFPTAILFFIAGVVVGYFWRLNPWLCGLCLLAIFPLTSIVEATVYKGSHNLIPFEFIIHFIFALPSIIGVYVGRYILSKRKRLVNERAK